MGQSINYWIDRVLPLGRTILNRQEFYFLGELYWMDIVLTLGKTILEK